jgi:hypothetical protein
MRHRLVLITTGLALVGAICAAIAGASSNLPKLIAGRYHGTKPSAIYFSGDGGNIVTKLHWTSWTSKGASGTGTSVIQNCIPNCASGKQTPYKTTVTFSDVSKGHFTKVVEVRDHQRLVAHYGRTFWPEGAS